MFVSCYWSHLCAKSQLGKQWFSMWTENGGLYKYLSRINVGYMSVLFWSVHFHPKWATNQMQIPVRELKHPKWTLNVRHLSLLGMVPRSTVSSTCLCCPDDPTLNSQWDKWHSHIAQVAKGMMTSCLLLSERLKEDSDDNSWTLSAAMCLCAAVWADTWRGAFAASCLSGLLWPVYNWWVEWIRDEFVTVNQPDGDGQSSSLALLIWLMMTLMVMMRPGVSSTTLF